MLISATPQWGKMLHAFVALWLTYLWKTLNSLSIEFLTLEQSQLL